MRHHCPATIEAACDCGSSSRCPECHGTGGCAIERGSGHCYRCQLCGGSGRYDEHTCSECGGYAEEDGLCWICTVAEARRVAEPYVRAMPRGALRDALLTLITASDPEEWEGHHAA
jgi:hypothetical protein